MSPEETAAIAAAIERFVSDTTPPAAAPQAPPDEPGPWVRAARREAVGLAGPPRFPTR